MTILLEPGDVSLEQLEEIYRHSPRMELAADGRAAVEQSYQRVAAAAKGNDALYGINTGFGKLANTRIDPEDTATLQRNLILSHCCGVGEDTDLSIVRLIIVLKLISLGRGASGVSWTLMTTLQKMINEQVIPAIPAQGSIGASGDLAPLAHMTAVLMGIGHAYYKGEKLPADAAMEKAGIPLITLGPKEGLAMINGTQFSTAHALAALFDSWRLIQAATISSALTTDAIMGSTAPFTEEIHTLRGHKGQIDVAATLRKLLNASEIRDSHLTEDERVQDPYCIRCQPQVTGAALDLLRQATTTLLIEANAVTDNPLILSDPDEIVSGGNFHAEPVAFAADQIAIALSEIGAIAQRRIALMVDPVLNHNLPIFLTPSPGLNSGMMIAEVTSAALMSENKHLANPCSTDSTPTSANQEDHVSMAAHGARRLLRMVENLSHLVGIETLCAIQGIEFREPLKTSPALQAVCVYFRRSIDRLETDRYMHPDLEMAANLILSGGFIAATGQEKLYEYRA
ncbi:MAG: histidine ammonia-lyase [bacterium]